MPASTRDSQPRVKALRFYDRGDLRLEEVEALPCGSDDVRLQIKYCGICGTDVTEYTNGPIFPPSKGHKNALTGVSLPVVMGHEFAGTITEVGSSVTELTTGQRVAVNPACDHRHYASEHCDPCRNGHYNICDATATYGLSAPGGGFSQEIVVKAINCFVLPENVDLKSAALVEPLAVAHHCIKLADFKAGQTALICGAGPIGLAILLILRVLGASKVIVTEVLETRMSQAWKFGADCVLSPLQSSDIDTSDEKSTLDAIRDFTQGGVDVAFDATGLQSTLDLAIAASKPRGTIFNVAIHKKPLSLNLNLLAIKEKRLLAGICYLAEDFEAVIQMMADGSLQADAMITSIVPLSDIIEGGFEQLIHNRDAHVKILIRPD
ncbi:GroES-like protein [Aureobasidium subglaciale]|nr:GroES-like protein [Aureobasidium subglaciale]